MPILQISAIPHDIHSDIWLDSRQFPSEDEAKARAKLAELCCQPDASGADLVQATHKVLSLVAPRLLAAHNDGYGGRDFDRAVLQLEYASNTKPPASAYAFIEWTEGEAGHEKQESKDITSSVME